MPHGSVEPHWGQGLLSGLASPPAVAGVLGAVAAGLDGACGAGADASAGGSRTATPGPFSLCPTSPCPPRVLFSTLVNSPTSMRCLPWYGEASSPAESCRGNSRGGGESRASARPVLQKTADKARASFDGGGDCCDRRGFLAVFGL